MKDKIRHFLDLLFVTLCYLGVLVFPLYIVLNILNVCTTNNGIFDLVTIVLSLILLLACREAVKGARRSHNGGNRYLF